ncbi:hypothetical protein MRB53_037620 [Persea americana]|nr:hypothetical protein MRB53_037620 [Persea americana]
MDRAGSAGAESEDEGGLSKSRSHSKKSRSGASNGQRDKELREKERERERERLEAAGRRKGRAERRHIDEPLEEVPTRSHAAKGPTRSGKNGASAAAVPPTPPLTASTSHKKQGRPVMKRGRVGRNQYTKDREIAHDESPRASHGKDDESTTGNDGRNGLLANGSKPAKPKHMNPNRTSMNDLRKRISGIMEFLSRTQLEMATEKSSPHSASKESGSSRASVQTKGTPNGTGGVKDDAAVEEGEASLQKSETAMTEPKEVDEEAFKQMSSVRDDGRPRARSCDVAERVWQMGRAIRMSRESTRMLYEAEQKHCPEPSNSGKPRPMYWPRVASWSAPSQVHENAVQIGRLMFKSVTSPRSSSRLANLQYRYLCSTPPTPTLHLYITILNT